MENPELQGIMGIVPTPLTDDGDVDESGLSHLIEHCVDSGLHGAVVLGSDGDFPFLTCEQKRTVIRTACEAGAKKIPVITGATAFGTREAVEYARLAGDAGCQAVLAALPMYWRLGLEEIKLHFKELANQGGLPIIFYHFPETTSTVLSPEEIAQVTALSGVHGAKITVMNRSFLKRIIKLTRTGLSAVFAGSSFMMRHTLKNGGAGVLCPLPLIAPEDCLALYNAMDQGEMDKAQDLQDHLLGALPIMTELDYAPSVSIPYFKAMAAKPYTGPPERPSSTVALVKEALRLQGHPVTSVVPGPCPPITREQSDLVKKTLEAQGWL